MKKFFFSALLAVMSFSPVLASDLNFLSYPELLKIWKQDQQRNQGYVWTINIHGLTMINAVGLMEASYAINLSISHVGPTMNGVYNGNFGLAASRDTRGFEKLLETIGGTLDTDSDIEEMSSNQYLFVLNQFSKQQSDVWDENFGKDALYSGMSKFEEEVTRSVFEGFYEYYTPRMKPFEMTSLPVSMGYAFQLPDGSSGSYQNARIEIRNGYMNLSDDASVELGLTDSGTIDQSSWTHVRTFMGDEHYKTYVRKNVNPIPHTIKVYPNNRVVLEIFSSNGGPVTAKFYGTIDRIPVGNTIVATENAIKKSQSSTAMTDDSLEQQLKDADVILSARKAEKEAEEAAKLQAELSEERNAMAKEDAEVLSVWKEKLVKYYPIWEGGYDYSLTTYDDYPDNYWFSLHSESNLIPGYKAKLKAAGFKQQRKGSDGSLYKVIDGKYYGFMIPVDEPEFEDGYSSFILYTLDKDAISRVKEYGEK